MVDPEARHLRSFLAAAEELHFGRAAARLHLTQQALSGHIRQLEALLGTVLFVRTTRSVALTPSGRALRSPPSASSARSTRRSQQCALPTPACGEACG